MRLIQLTRVLEGLQIRVVHMTRVLSGSADISSSGEDCSGQADEAGSPDKGASGSPDKAGPPEEGSSGAGDKAGPTDKGSTVVSLVMEVRLVRRDILYIKLDPGLGYCSP